MSFECLQTYFNDTFSSNLNKLEKHNQGVWRIPEPAPMKDFFFPNKQFISVLK